MKQIQDSINPEQIPISKNLIISPHRTGSKDMIILGLAHSPIEMRFSPLVINDVSVGNKEGSPGRMSILQVKCQNP